MELDWRARLSEVRALPNLISLSRLPLVVAILVLLDSPWRYPLFALVILSDAVDGWVARRLDQSTELGAVLDPALDKVTALLLFVVLFPRTGLAPGYLLLFFGRDLFVLLLGALFPLFETPDPDKIKARPLGKAVTNAQFLAMVAMLVPHVLATEALLWVLGVVSTLAIADYTVFFGREVTDSRFVHGRQGAVAAYLGAGSLFGIVVLVLLPGELTGFLDVVTW
jgi:phosphatidylglycerophosphate synthase